MYILRYNKDKHFGFEQWFNFHDKLDKDIDVSINKALYFRGSGHKIMYIKLFIAFMFGLSVGVWGSVLLKHFLG